MSTTINWDELKARYWDISEIVTTNPAVTGQKVARVGDFVVDWDVGIYRVSAVEPGTNIATLEIKHRFSDSTLIDASNGSLISALSMYMPNSATRSIYNDEVSPATITTDHRYITRGIESVEMRVFYGVDISDTGEVISARFDGGGNQISDLIPLVEVVTGEPRIKRPPVFETTKVLKSDDIITYVFYDAAGHKSGVQPFLVSEGGAIFDYNSGAAFITGIELRGDMIDDTDTKLINNPLNTPFQTALLEAWLTYSDGSEVRVPIDGNKCRLEGVSTFNTSDISTPKNVVLIYDCDPGEPAVNTGGALERFIAEQYKLANIVVDTSFSLKLFAVPKYQDNTTGWLYDYYLTSLAGDVDAEVTNFVTARDDNGDPVPGTNHGNPMQVTMGLDLDTVLPGAYPDHYHTQMYTLTTQVPGATVEHFTLDYQNGGTQVYRCDEYAHGATTGDGQLNISQDFASLNLFLGELYLNIHPLYDTSVLIQPEDPTHAVIMYEGAELEIELATQWDQTISFPTGWPLLEEYKTVVLKWIVRDGSNDYIKGYTPMLIRMDL